MESGAAAYYSADAATGGQARRHTISDSDMGGLHFLLVSYLMVWSGVSAGPLWNLVHDLVQWNLAGIPTIHEKSKWDFNPDAGKDKRAVYEELNGRLGEKAIARIGDLTADGESESEA